MGHGIKLDLRDTGVYAVFRDLEHDTRCLSYYHGGQRALSCLQDVLSANLCRVAFARFPFYSRRSIDEMRTRLVHDRRDCGIGFATIDDKRSCFAYIVPSEQHKRHIARFKTRIDTGIILVR